MPTKAELEEEIRVLKSEINSHLQREEQHEAWKAHVGERAMELAEEHDWCSLVSETCGELGIPVPARDVSITITLLASSNARMDEDPSVFVRESIKVEPEEIFDEDFFDVKITSVRAVME